MAVQSGTAKLWLEKTGCPIVEGYGLSETSPSATCNPVDSTAYSGNIGLPMPNTELKLIDDDGNEVPTGTPGEIAIKGPQVMAGYWQRPDETAKVMTDDGFFRSGDIGTVDERGYFRIVDRKKDMYLAVVTREIVDSCRPSSSAISRSTSGFIAIAPCVKKLFCRSTIACETRWMVSKRWRMFLTNQRASCSRELSAGPAPLRALEPRCCRIALA